MAQENLTGFINPGKPVLFTMPKMPTPATRKTTTTKEDDEEVTALYGHTLSYELAKSRLNQYKLGANAELQKILKEDYGGDTSAFVKDERVQGIMNNYSMQKASLAASKNSIETEYKSYEKARDDIKNKSAGTKFATGESGLRLFKGPDGQIYDEGTAEGRGVPKEDRAYMTNNQLLLHNREKLSIVQSKDGQYMVQKGRWSDPADYSKDAVGEFLLKNMSAASGQFDSVPGSVQEGETPGGQGYLTGVNRKWNLQNLAEMNEWTQGNIPSEVKKQLLQRAWENGVFETDQKVVTAPVLNENNQYVTKDGEVVMEQQMMTVTPQMREKLLEKQKNGTIQPWEKELLNENNQVSDQYKFAKYFSDVATNYEEGLTSDLYGQRIAGAGSGSGSGSKQGLTKENSYIMLLKSEDSDYDVQTFYTPTGKTNEEGLNLMEKKEIVGRTVSLQGDALGSVINRNAEWADMYQDDEGEIDKTKINKMPALEEMGAFFEFNGQAFSTDQLQGARIVKQSPIIIGMPKMKKNKNGTDAYMVESSTEEGALAPEEMQAYYEYEIAVEMNDENMAFFENNGIIQKGEYKEGQRKDYVAQGGLDVDINPAFGWWGYQNSDEGDALGLGEGSTDGFMSGDRAIIKIRVPVSSAAANFEGKYYGGNATADNTGTVRTTMGRSPRERASAGADQARNYHTNI